MADEKTAVVLLGAAGALWLLFGRGRKETPSGGIVIVRARPPRSHHIKNLMVLAIVAALAWWFWYVEMTRCNGAC